MARGLILSFDSMVRTVDSTLRQNLYALHFERITQAAVCEGAFYNSKSESREDQFIV